MTDSLLSEVIVGFIEENAKFKKIMKELRKLKDSNRKLIDDASSGGGKGVAYEVACLKYEQFVVLVLAGMIPKADKIINQDVSDTLNNDLNEAISDYVRKKYGINIGPEEDSTLLEHIRTRIWSEWMSINDPE